MSELNGEPIPNPSGDQRPVPPVPPAPDAYSATDGSQPAGTPPTAPPAYQQQPYGQPAAAQYGQPYAPAPVDPGKTLGIVGLVLAFVFSLAGIIVSAIGLSRSKKAGFKNPIALTGLILSIVFFVISVIVAIVFIIGFVALAQYCAENGVTTGSSYNCSSYSG